MQSFNHIQTAKDAYHYARDVIKGRFPEREAMIATNPHWAYRYAYYAIDGRFPEGEAIIATEPHWAYQYSYNIIKSRWLEGELQILFSEYAIKYAELYGIDNKIML